MSFPFFMSSANFSRAQLQPAMTSWILACLERACVHFTYTAARLIDRSTEVTLCDRLICNCKPGRSSGTA